ncbi:DUF2834 domain-containing protein [Cryptosporangium minutisporangium]|uniref:DUF2834 domain-containing protein n=1 Tax=Cryptosporangium minutisporangium TaxID=113569 RepID=A0ABP6T1I3_9ACTN
MCPVEFTRASRRRQTLYAAFLVAGLVLPYRHAVPWLADHGPDVPRFALELFATPISSFFALDVLVTAALLLTVAAVDERLRRRDRALVAAGSLAGASVGLPLYLLLRERAHRTPTGAVSGRPPLARR